MDTELIASSKLDAALLEGDRAYLDKIVKQIAEFWRVPVTSVLLRGAIPDAIEKQVATVNADLIVMTTHGRGSFGRFWLGSVADEIVRRTPVPILLVRPHEAKLDLAAEPPFHHVLVPLDGSALAEQILDPAINLANVLEADCTLVRVIKPMVLGNFPVHESYSASLDETILEELRKLFEADQTKANRYLAGLTERLKGGFPKLRSQVLVHEQPAEAILQDVKSRRVDLVAIATHGRSGLPRLLLGSVADKILRGTSVPILIQRPRNK
jgi:nucleotide-binding universal stress UspA family protein